MLVTRQDTNDNDTVTAQNSAVSRYHDHARAIQKKKIKTKSRAWQEAVLDPNCTVDGTITNNHNSNSHSVFMDIHFCQEVQYDEKKKRTEDHVALLIRNQQPIFKIEDRTFH